MKNDALFQQVIGVILANEGGYVNHPDDPGGETKYGITKRQFPNIDIKNLTEEKAKEIYYSHYWLPLKKSLDQLKDPELVLHVFDMGINAGPTTAMLLLQAAFDVEMDGQVGPQTVTAIRSFPNPVETYKTARDLYYKILVIRDRKNKVFLKGWTNRVKKTKLR